VIARVNPTNGRLLDERRARRFGDGASGFQCALDRSRDEIVDRDAAKALGDAQHLLAAERGERVIALPGGVQDVGLTMAHEV
jgi:hypothetical protein